MALAALPLVLTACSQGSVSRAPAAGGAAPAMTLVAVDAATPIVEAATATAESLATATPGVTFDPLAIEVTLEPVTERLEKPIGLAQAGDGSGRLFVVEKAGTVRIVRDGQVAREPFLDMRDRVRDEGSEQGLLGLAFHPGFAEGAGRGRLFVNYTDRQGNTVVAEYGLTTDPDRADPASERVLLHVDQPAANHNGGQLAFGPDGYLYIGLGDGGGSGDQYKKAQGRGELLGKLLRIDVDGSAPYAVPADNPFVGRAGIRPEIWAYGLRNPWRFSFDRATGDLYIADVGQATWEEIDRQPAGDPGGENYGWPILEGDHCYQGGTDCDAAGETVRPILEYEHGADGCAITGGYVYRGRQQPALWGVFLYGDYCSGRIWAAWPAATGVWRQALLTDTDLAITTFGEDGAGEVYVTDYDGGAVYRIAVLAGARVTITPASHPPQSAR